MGGILQTLAEGTKIIVYDRAAGFSHRSGVNAVDKLTVSSAALVSADVAAGGHLPHTTTYKSCYAPGNEYGTAGISAIGSVATAADANNTHMVDVTVPQVVGASYYDVFLSTDAAPLWVGRVTEAQRAAGAKITAVGTVTSPSAGVAAGDVRVDVVGTGIATTNVVFSANVAYVIPATYTKIDCTGKTFVDIFVNFGLTDLRTAPSLTLIPLFKTDETVATWYATDYITVPIMAGTATQVKQQVFTIDVFDVDEILILVGTLTGQGATVALWAGAA